MYSINQIERLQIDPHYFKKETEEYCLVPFRENNLSFSDVELYCNFCIQRVIHDYNLNLLTDTEASDILDEIEVFEYSTDLLGELKTIEKLRDEILLEKLHLEDFNYLVVRCDTL